MVIVFQKSLMKQSKQMRDNQSKCVKNEVQNLFEGCSKVFINQKNSGEKNESASAKSERII